MNKRKQKKLMKKVLDMPRLAIRESGLLNGYTCPNCGRRHVKDPFCENCKQRLIYEESQRKDTYAIWGSLKEWEEYKKKYIEGELING